MESTLQAYLRHLFVSEHMTHFIFRYPLSFTPYHLPAAPPDFPGRVPGFLVLSHSFPEDDDASLPDEDTVGICNYVF